MSPEVVDQVRSLYLGGQCLDALKAAQAAAPLHLWRGTSARLVAGRLARNVGAPRLAAAHEWIAYRQDPAHPEAADVQLRRLLGQRGPWFAMGFAQERGELTGAAPATQAHWLATQAIAASLLRDFDTADALIARALKLAPADAWTHVEYASVLQQQDRYDEALAVTGEALALHPWYRPAVQHRAHLLCLRDRDADARELLEQATTHTQNAWLMLQLSELLKELGEFAQAREALDRVIALAPLLEKKLGKWLAARRSDAAYDCGDFAAAAALARESDNPFHQDIAPKLESPEPGLKQVRLPVPFVRQHHNTCAPATLASLSRYWSMSAEHLEIVEEICYDGTPAYSERQWAVTHGFVAREFAVTFESAVALIDRGVPFTLTTVAPTSAHLQAVIGYDSRRGTILIRDPSNRHVGEFLIDGLVKYQKSTGPRGMLLVPADRAALLEGIELPDAVLYDHFHQLNHALQHHHRADAERALAAMTSVDPQHRLTVWGERALAGYDGNPTAMLGAIDKLLAMYPEDDFLQLSRLSFLRSLARREEMLATLAKLCDKPKADPVYLQYYASELAADARQHALAQRLLRQSLRGRPGEAQTYYTLANVLWDQRQFDPALQLYRIASCLGDKIEHYALTFFNAMRALRRGEEATAVLRRRYERYGARSSQPAMSLFTALGHQCRFDEGFAVLAEAMQQRPDDGNLLLFSADAHARHGMFQRAEALLESAKGKAREAALLRSAANLAMQRGDAAESRRLWLEVLDREPLAIDALSNAALSTAELQGRAAALLLLYQWGERFPHNYDVHRTLVDWLRGDDDVEALEAAIAHLIDIHPADGWAKRELALVKVRRGDLAGALSAAEAAVGVEPGNADSFSTLAWVQSAMARPADAAESCRAAIRLSVDCDSAMRQLMQLSEEPQQRRAALAFVKAELEKQVIFGQGLLAYRYYASNTLGDEEILAGLREALDVRPDLWQAWAAVARQLIDAGQLDEALTQLQQATQRFPLVAQLWLDLAYVQRLRGQSDAERQAIEHAGEISPAWSLPPRLLADQMVRCGELDQARAAAERAVAVFPLDAETHRQLGEILWRLNDREQALAKIEAALQIEPGNEAAWDRLRQWSAELKRPEAPVELARKLTQRRPGDARLWLLLAQTLSRPEDLDERMAALARAESLSPGDTDPHDMRVHTLAMLGRFDEALAACRPAAWGDQPPLRLRARAAWVEAERGNLGVAIGQMQKVVEEDPKYYWALHQLAEWQQRQGNLAEYEKAASRLVQCAPHDAAAFGMLAHAYERQNKRAEAKAAYQRAIEIDPAYRFAGLSLFDLQLADRELDAAGATLAVMQRHCASVFTSLRQVQLTFARSDVNGAIAGFIELCRDPANDAGPVEFLFDHLADGGVRKLLEQPLYELCRSGQGLPEAGRFWARLVCHYRWGWREVRRGIASFRKAGEASEPHASFAAAVYLGELARTGRRWPMRWYLYRHRAWLHRHLASWSGVSYCLTTTGWYRRCIEWLADWRSREGVEQWVLSNLLSSQKALGLEAAAVETARHALTLPDCDRHHGPKLWLAWAEATSGDVAAAADRLKRVNLSDAWAGHGFLASCLQVLIDLAEVSSRPAAIDRTVGECQQQLWDATTQWPQYARDAAYRRAYLRAVRAIAAARPGLGMRLWNWGQHARVLFGRIGIDRIS